MISINFLKCWLKLEGVWYDISIDKDSYDPNTVCVKIDTKLDEKGTFMVDGSQIKTDGSQENAKLSFETDPKKPGELYYELPVKDDTILGSKSRTIRVSYTVVYTDYENIAVFYSCYETKWSLYTINHPHFLVVARNKDFDNLDDFAKATQSINDLGISYNDFVFFNNDPSKCKI